MSAAAAPSEAQPGSVRLAVIGVGHLGRHHARLAATVPRASLVAVVDVVEDRAREAARATGALALTDYRALFGRVDAVVVAVPTVDHLRVAREFLDRGVHVLVEKPMAASLADADALVEAAERSGARLAVGHTERHNPAVGAALPIVTSPRFIEVHRLSGFPERSLDIDVVFDVMIHDLDIVLAMDRIRGARGRRRRRAGAHAAGRYRQRPHPLRVRMRGQHHGEPDQPGQGAEDPLLPAGHVRLGGLSGAGARGLAARAPGGRAPGDRRAARSR